MTKKIDADILDELLKGYAARGFAGYKEDQVMIRGIIFRATGTAASSRG